MNTKKLQKNIIGTIILHMVKLFHIKIGKISFYHNSNVKVNNLPPPPPCHIDVKLSNLNIDVAPKHLVF